MKSLRPCLLLFLWACAVPTVAAPTAVVEAVVMPAWLERGGRSEAIAPGVEVRQGDQLRTGSTARIYLRLPEGSIVKLGANARFALGKQEVIDKDFFAAAYDVLAGAFRFTTDKLRRHQPVRDVSIKVATATIGIRGTDVWGKTEADQDLVILIEGNIIVSHESGVVTPMGAERATFIAPRGGKPLPLSRIGDADLAQKARETEIEAGAGAVGRIGKVKLRLGTGLSQEGALALRDSAGQAGYAVAIKPRAATDGGWAFDVLIGGFADRAEAVAVLSRLPEKLRAAAEVR